MSVNSVDSVEGIGNTNDPLKKKKQVNACSNWCFTYNNYEESEIVSIVHTLGGLGDYVFQREIGETGTKHLQGCIKLLKRSRPTSFNLSKKIHWEPCRSWKHSVDYCSKEDSREPNTKPFTNIKLARKLVKMTYEKLRPDQKIVADYFREPEDALFGRTITWIWEPDGNWGKSVLTKYFLDSHNLSCLPVASKSNDAFFQIAKHVEEHGEGPDIVIYDIPRCMNDYISYQSIEKIKDGCFSSGKYESCCVRINSPHIICFSNETPDRKALSKDRWNIIRCDQIATKMSQVSQES
jgi:hypothetical protein